MTETPTLPEQHPKRVIIACGGTGGHIYPGVAVAQALQSRAKAAGQSTEVLFIGNPDRMEVELIPREGYPFHSITVKGFRRSFKPGAVLANVVNIIRLLTLWPLLQAARHFASFPPDVVIGVGGYVSGPVLLYAWLRGIPTLVIEPNALPGVTNRLAAKFASACAVAFPEASKRLGQPAKTHQTGNPLRASFFADSEEPLPVEVPDGKQLVLIVGGSLGAQRLNTAVEDLLIDQGFQKYAKDKLVIVHVLGKRFSAKSPLEEHLTGSYIRLDYLHAMPQVLRRTDLIICRAGAGMLAEITAVGVPSILVPWPEATDNHQEINARAVADAGGGRLLLERELSSEWLGALVKESLKPATNAKMREAAKHLGAPDAAEKVVDLLLDLHRQRSA